MKYYIYFFVALITSFISLSSFDEKTLVITNSDANSVIIDSSNKKNFSFIPEVSAQVFLPAVSGIDSAGNVNLSLQKIDKPITTGDILVYCLSFIFSLLSIFVIKWCEYLFRKKIKF